MLNISLVTSHRSLLLSLFGISLILFSLCGCKEDTGVNNPTLTLPARYDSTGFFAATLTEASVRRDLAQLTAVMQVGRNMDSTLNTTRLLNLWNGTTLQSVTPAGFRTVIEASLADLAAGTGKGARFAWENAPTTGSTGGVIPTSNAATAKTGYLYDRFVMEHEQLVEKGLFFGAMYQHAAQLINAGNPTKVTIDKLVSIYGATPGFGNNERNADPNRDRFTAQYAARRSDTLNSNSLYNQLRLNLLTARAAIEAGSAFNQQRDDALNAFLLNFERVIAATVINYCHTTLTVLNSGNRTDSAVTSAMHAYGECVGFLYGMRAATVSNKRITNQQCDALLGLLRAPYGQASQAYLFLSNQPATAQLYRFDGRNDPNDGVIETLQQIYGFTNQDIESFRRNWVADQGRR